MAATPLAAVMVVLIFAGASFFFSLAETSLFSLSKWQVRHLAEQQARAGALVEGLLAEPQDLLATMVLGNTFANAAMLAVALWMALDRPLANTHNDPRVAGTNFGGLRGVAQNHGGA